VINDKVFKHAPISWEWAIVFISAIIFMGSIEAWKLAKRLYIRRREVKLGITRSDTVADQRYEVPV
jgi:P-type Na+/K+ transporter